MAIDLSSPAIIGSFYEQLDAEWAKSWASGLGWLNPSNQETETYNWLSDVPKFRQWIGGRAANQLKTRTYSIINKTWEQTLQFNVEDIRRDKTGQVDVRIGELAQAGAAFWEDLVSTLILNGGATNCYDSQYSFDTDHPVQESTTSSTTATNAITASQVSALNISTATAPTPDEAAKAIQGIVGYFHTYKGDQGHKLNANARNFTLMVGTIDLWAPIMTALSQTNLTSGASNPISGLKSAGYNLNCILNPDLSAKTTEIYAFRTDAKLKPFILQEELATEVKVIGAGSELEFQSNVHQFGTKRIGNAGYGLWQYAIQATLS